MKKMGFKNKLVAELDFDCWGNGEIMSSKWPRTEQRACCCLLWFHEEVTATSMEPNKMLKNLRELGHHDVMLKCSGGVQDEVVGKREEPTIQDNSPVGGGLESSSIQPLGGP